MRFAVMSLLLLCAGTQALMAQSDQVEVGVFADYFNLSRTTPNINYAGLGARVGFNVMGYD